jgi:hypothetical protein
MSDSMGEPFASSQTGVLFLIVMGHTSFIKGMQYGFQKHNITQTNQATRFVFYVMQQNHNFFFVFLIFFSKISKEPRSFFRVLVTT